MRPVPSLAAQVVEPEIIASYRPSQGLVIVSGSVGSGRATLVAGMTAAKLGDPDGHSNIVEGAAPVAYRFDDVYGASSTISQSEIPRDFPSFAAFVRSAMRREPTDIIVGECRDSKTMSAMVEAAISGTTVTTTLHANDVVSTIRRILALCPSEGRDDLVSMLAQSLRLIISQRMTRSIDGRRTPLREFLVFDADLRAEFQRRDTADWPALARVAVTERGQSFRKAIENALQAGRISDETAAHELREAA